MASINKVVLIGNLGNDPEVRQFPNGGTAATINLATQDRQKNQAGEWQDRAEWHKVEFQNGLADVVSRYLKKGMAVYVEGSLRTRQWTDKTTGQPRYATYIRAEVMRMLGKPASDPDAGYGELSE